MNATNRLGMRGNFRRRAAMMSLTERGLSSIQ
jgi:hypothetical protein